MTQKLDYDAIGHILTASSKGNGQEVDDHMFCIGRDRQGLHALLLTVKPTDAAAFLSAPCFASMA